MLNIEINEKKESPFKIETTGSVKSIVAEISVTCGLIYARLKNIDSSEAEMFRIMLAIALLPEAPAWSPPAEFVESTIMVVPGKDGNEWVM